MTIPIYLFTGFLESGKTSLIKDTLLDPGFTTGEKTLLVICEEGMEEYDQEFLKKTNTVLASVETKDELNYTFLKNLDSVVEPDRVMIEFNGMWNLTEYLDTVDFPFDWLLVQILSTVNASTFELYLNNMRSQIFEQLVHSETIIFNRCDEQTKKLFLRNNIKAINKGAQIIYETKDGEITNLGEDELPFDLSQDQIDISDDDYGLWYMDAMEHPYKYEGKTMSLKGKVIANHVADKTQAFVFGRHAMVCCADDTSLIGLLCYYEYSSDLIPKEWVQLTAELTIEYDEEYQGDVPVLHVKQAVFAEPLEDEFVYFT